MPNFCPSCGAKVDEGYKFCLSCGAKLQTESTNEPSNPEEQIVPEPPTQQPDSQDSITQATQPRKSNKILLMSLIAIIAVIIIIVVIVFMFTGGGVIDNRFVGEWEQSDGEVMTIDWTFKSDGSLEIMGMDLASWNVKGNQLCFKTNEFWDEFMQEGPLDEVCYNFEFSAGGNTVALSIEGSENFILIKK